jgi:hypothetical protein
MTQLDEALTLAKEAGFRGPVSTETEGMWLGSLQDIARLVVLARSAARQQQIAGQAVVLSHYDGSAVPTKFVPEYAAQDLTAEMWDKDAQLFSLVRERGVVKLYLSGSLIWPAPAPKEAP